MEETRRKHTRHVRSLRRPDFSNGTRILLPYGPYSLNSAQDFRDPRENLREDDEGIAVGL